VAIITDIGISHLEFFPSADSLAAEKLSILKGLKPSGVAILNADNPKVLYGRVATKAKIITYGFNPADIQAQDLQFSTKGGQKGLAFKIIYKEDSIPCLLPDAAGQPAV